MPIEAEYLSNPSDIIDEEEYEDSEEEKEYQERQKEKVEDIAKPDSRNIGGNILNKVKTDDLLEFAEN